MGFSEWKEIRLGDFIKIKHGYAFDGKSFSEERLGRPIIVNIGNLDYSGGFRFDRTKVRECIDDYPEDYVLKSGDVLLAMTCQTSGGEILGVPGTIPCDGNTYLHNQRLGKVMITRPNEINLNYIYYLCLWSKFRHELFVTSTGTKILHTSPSRIENFKFLLPTLGEQKAIANILSTLDEKIQTNNKINENLQSISQLLFKHWFVDFEFPSEEGLPYKSSGGEMVDSEIGMIPKEWEVKTVKDIVNNYDSKRKPLSSRQREGKRGIYPYYGATSIIDFVDDYIFDGIYVLLGEDGTVINEDGTPVLQYIWKKAWINNHAHVLQGKGISTELLYLYLKQLNVSSIVTGAVQLKINQANLNSVKILHANQRVIVQFEQLIKDLFAIIRSLTDENDNLKTLRDTLLPKLMSGEIELSNLQL